MNKFIIHNKFQIPEYVVNILSSKTIESQSKYFDFYFCRGSLVVMYMWGATLEVIIPEKYTSTEKLSILDYNLFIQKNILVGIEVENKSLFCFKDNFNHNNHQIYVSKFVYIPEHVYEKISAEWFYFGFNNNESLKELFHSVWKTMPNDPDSTLLRKISS